MTSVEARKGVEMQASGAGAGAWLALGGAALLVGAAVLLWASEGANLFVEAAFGALLNCF